MTQHTRQKVRSMRLAGMAALLALLLAGAVHAAEVYAKIEGAKVRQSASATSPVISELKKGTRITVLADGGTRYRVTLSDGRSGYVSKLHVSTTPPTAGGGALSGLGRADVRVTEAQSVSSMRGLSPAAKKLAENEKLSAQAVAWVEKMESDSVRVTELAVEQFLREGNVGF